MINTTLPWRQLELLQQEIYTKELVDLYTEDKHRMEKYSLKAAGLFLDFSKNYLNDEIFELLLALTTEANLEEKIKGFFAGELINHTEKKSAEHPELRKPLSRAKPEVIAGRKQINEFVTAIHDGELVGATNEKFTDVVNIGIGGSDLGPKVACEALKEYQINNMKFHFISNIDDYPLNNLLDTLNPETTLFIVASKSFSTPETLKNMETAQAWFKQSMTEDAWQKHSVAVTANPEKAMKQGFQESFIFPFGDTIGGRYSLWSAVGLSIALCVGNDNFEKLLNGAHAMDEHFRTSEFHQNMPVILALLEVWYNNFWGGQSHAIIPYLSQLNLLPSYLQQLVMESNGKAVNSEHEFVNYDTSPIIWGEAGTNCQHSFMQLFHQSLRLIPVDFIASLTTKGDKEHHQQLLANCFSQARVLMLGKELHTAEEELVAAGNAEEAKTLAPHKVLPGNNPSNTLLMEALTPETVGALIGLYEHKVFVSAMIWDINPFDQWGVEMGKVVAKDLLPKIQKNELDLDYDPSTNTLIKLYRDNNNEKT